MTLRERIALRLLRKQATDQQMSAILTLLHQQGEPPKRGTAEVIAAYRSSPWLRAVTNKIAIKVASVPWRLLRLKSGGRVKRNKTIQSAGYHERKDMIIRFKQAGGEVEEITDHPLLKLLQVANPVMTGLTARKVTQLYLDLPGECGWIIERDKAGKPAEIWPIPPNWITDTPSARAPWFNIRIRAQQIKVPVEDFIWFREVDPANPYGRGTGIAQSLGDEIDSDEYASQMIKATFFNRARPELLVAIEGAKKEQIKQAQQHWDNANRGHRRASRTHFHSGKMVVKELQQKFSELQLTELRQFERDTFISVYGVPPELLGVLSSSNRATITEARGIMATEVVIPRMEFQRSELQTSVVPEFDDAMILDYEDPAPEDYDFKLDAVKATPWAFTVGEIRTLGGAPHRGEQDDVHMVPVNLFAVASIDGATPPLDKDETKAIELRSPKLLPAPTETKDATVELILDELRPDRIATEVRPIYAREMEMWTVDEIALLEATELSFDMLVPILESYIEEQIAEQVTNIDNTTRAALREVMVEGRNAGQNPRVIARAVQDVMDDASRRRAVVIARTEATRYAESAKWEVQKRVPTLIDRRQWLASFVNTRDPHARAHMQIVAVTEPYIVGGEALMYPGDPAGSGWNTISCQCTSVALTIGARSTEGLTDEKAEEIWREFIRRVTPWEREIAAAIRRGFDDQLRDILIAMDKYLGEPTETLSADHCC